MIYKIPLKFNLQQTLKIQFGHFVSKMEIQQKQEQRMSDSQDSWDPQESKDSEIETQKASLFSKITVKYDDRMIQKNIDVECEKPILNSDLFPFQDEDNNQQQKFEQTQEEPNLGDKKKHQMQTQENRSSQNNVKETQNCEALFNAVEDEQNQSWMRKKVKQPANIFQNKKQLRPLTCPQCFTQVCYVYEAIKQNSKGQKKQPQNTGNNPVKSQKSYKAKVVDNVVIHQHKIIRNRFASENMEKKPNRQGEKINSVLGKKLELYERDLKIRYQDINVKILVSCEGCGLQLGYWDVNEQMYVLFNII